jgi:hypothetical protein
MYVPSGVMVFCAAADAVMINVAAASSSLCAFILSV